MVGIALNAPCELRLGFVSARSASRVGGVFTDAGLARLIEALRRRCRQLTVALAEQVEREPLHDHELSLGDGDYLPLPPMPSFVRGVRLGRHCRSVIREVERRSDVVIVQLPFAAPTALLRSHRPRLYHICADTRAIVRNARNFGGAKQIAANFTADAVDRLYRWLAQRDDARVVANGEDLLRRFGRRGAAVVSSSIWSSDIMSVRRTRPAGAPFRVLFVGYLRPEKGVDILLDAFAQLTKRIPSCELHMLGAKDPAEHGVSAQLHDALGGLRGSVHFLGHRNFGPELFQCFADADVLAVPSRSEGTPRVLVEARAFGCTVVGSRVGGIPTSIEDGVDGLLVPPNHAKALAAALLRVATDEPLRARLVAGGLARARRTTVDAFADRMIEQAHVLAGGSR